MANASLRQLAKAFSVGNIDQTAYRKARTDLITGIIDGTIALEENTYPPLVNPSKSANQAHHEKTEIRSVPVSDQIHADTLAPMDGKLPIMVAAAGIIAVLLIIFIGFMVIPDTPEQTAEQKSADAKIAGEGAESPETNAGNKIIDDFLSQKLWGNEALQSFQIQWDQLTPEETRASLDSNAMKRLSNAIYRQLLEEQSLKAIGDSQAAAQRQEQLIDFSSSIGIADPRFHSSQFKSPE